MSSGRSIVKINFIKQAGGTLVPANDAEADKLTRFKTGELFEVDIKNERNPDFHRKVFAFFNFCFNFWTEFNSVKQEAAQFDKFRKDMLIQAGYYVQVFDLVGNFEIEAKSIAFGKMDQEEFEHCYSALINVALKTIFVTDDENTYRQLASFF